MSVSSTSARTSRSLTSNTVATVCPAATSDPTPSGGPVWAAWVPPPPSPGGPARPLPAGLDLGLDVPPAPGAAERRAVPASGDRRVRRSCWSWASSRASSPGRAGRRWPPRWSAAANRLGVGRAAASSAAWLACCRSSASTWARSMRAWSRACCASAPAAEAERMAAITAALVAATRDWTCWKADSAAPAGSPGATPRATRQRPRPPGPAAPGRRPGRRRARRPAPAPHLLPVFDHQPLDPRRRRRLQLRLPRRLHRPRRADPLHHLGRPHRLGRPPPGRPPESHPARTSTPTSKRGGSPGRPVPHPPPFLADDLPGQHRCRWVVLRPRWSGPDPAGSGQFWLAPEVFTVLN